MTDTFGRKIDYLRFSLTQHCQLHCPHCAAGGSETDGEYELNTQQVICLARVCSELGFEKIRFTGGEPLLRTDLSELIAAASSWQAYRDIALTPNAQLLSDCAAQLKKSGLQRVNISLNTLDEKRFFEFTGGSLQKTLNGIEAAFSCGLTPVKINVVLLKEKNDDEIENFLALAREYPLTVRFIELMPMGEYAEVGIRGSDILAGHPRLQPVFEHDSGVALYYSEHGAKGTVGFINPISSSFCAACNRLRITADGCIRPCLGDNHEISVLPFLQLDDETALRNCIAQAILSKPPCNSFANHFHTNRTMNRLGG